MAYQDTNLRRLADDLANNPVRRSRIRGVNDVQLWTYVTDDSLAEVSGPTFWNLAYRRVTADDVIFAFSEGGMTIRRVTATDRAARTVTTEDPANVGGGGGGAVTAVAGQVGNVTAGQLIAEIDAIADTNFLTDAERAAILAATADTTNQAAIQDILGVVAGTSVLPPTTGAVLAAADLVTRMQDIATALAAAGGGGLTSPLTALLDAGNQSITNVADLQANVVTLRDQGGNAIPWLLREDAANNAVWHYSGADRMTLTPGGVLDVLGGFRVNGVDQIGALLTLLGVTSGQTDFGTIFTGTTIPDNATLTAALQALETAVEAAGGASFDIIDAAGDLMIGTADNTVGRLGIGAALQQLRVNAAGTALEWAAPSSGVTNWLALNDTPNAFTGFASQLVRVNAGETALEFINVNPLDANLIDAAGDLLVGTADNTAGRLALGTANQVLRVNAGATALEYADPASSVTVTTVDTPALRDAVANVSPGDVVIVTDVDGLGTEQAFFVETAAATFGAATTRKSGPIPTLDAAGGTPDLAALAASPDSADVYRLINHADTGIPDQIIVKRENNSGYNLMASAGAFDIDSLPAGTAPVPGTAQVVASVGGVEQRFNASDLGGGAANAAALSFATTSDLDATNTRDAIEEVKAESQDVIPALAEGSQFFEGATGDVRRRPSYGMVLNFEGLADGTVLRFPPIPLGFQVADVGVSVSNGETTEFTAAIDTGPGTASNNIAGIVSVAAATLARTSAPPTTPATIHAADSEVTFVLGNSSNPINGSALVRYQIAQV